MRDLPDVPPFAHYLIDCFLTPILTWFSLLIYRQVLAATVQRRDGDTLYTRLGDGPFVVAALLALALAWLLTRHRL